MIHINITFCRFTMCMMRGKMEYKANLVSVLIVAIPLIVCTICYGAIFFTLGRLSLTGKMSYSLHVQ